MVELSDLLEDLAGSPEGISIDDVRRRVARRRLLRTGLRVAAAATVFVALVGVWSIVARDRNTRLDIQGPPPVSSVGSPSGSATTRARGGVTAKDLAGRGFDSIAVSENGVPRPFVADTRLTLVFNDGVSFSAGCNHDRAGYAVTNSMLSLGTSPVSYRRQCPPDLAAQEDRFFRLLGAPTLLALDGNRLTLTQGDVVIEMLDRTDPALPDWPLVGTNWTGTTVHADGVDRTVERTPINAAAPPSLLVDTSGAVTVSTGCSTGSGHATISGEQLILRDLELGPKMTVPPATEPCPSSLASMDPIVRSILREPLHVRITGVNLVLQTSDGRSVTFGGA